MKNTILIYVTFLGCIFITFHLLRTIENYDKSIDPKLYEIKKITNNVHSIISNVELYEDTKSYTINKEKIYLCLKDKNRKYYSDNMLVYVFLHEIAHILCDEVGHTEKFRNIFQDLLDKATEMKIYNPSIPVIDDYCE
jgi:predicted metal-dependent hydrolase